MQENVAGQNIGSVEQVFRPIVTVMRAYRRASRWKAITSGWNATSNISRYMVLFMALVVIVLAVLTLYFLEGWWLALYSAATGVLVWFVRYKIIEVDPKYAAYKENEKFLGVDYRFRRYLLFRAELIAAGLNRADVSRGREALSMERDLAVSPRTRFGPLQTFLISLITSLTAFLSTRESMVNSGWVWVVLIVVIFVLWLVYVMGDLFPGKEYNNQEMACFLGWYDMELAAGSGDSVHNRHERAGAVGDEGSIS